MYKDLVAIICDGFQDPRPALRVHRFRQDDQGTARMGVEDTFHCQKGPLFEQTCG